MAKPSPYIVGIDLGTTHIVVAYIERDAAQSDAKSIQVFNITQVVSPGEVDAYPLLPSFLLLPGAHEVAAGALALPWDKEAELAAGEFARTRGAEIPARLVSSAKSWLCHDGVDRRDAILPWDAPAETMRLSPLDATTHYLQHIRDSWNHALAGDNSKAALENQEIFLTVPASFDAVARELTVEAAKAAGLKRLTLLEEPQAAFYAWLEAQKDAWRDSVEVGETVLVCDIGGGTTDLSLIEVVEEEGDLGLRRVAVGKHILLGGDNMDLALAYLLRAKLAQGGTNIDAWQLRSLSHASRRAKERLLNDPELKSEPVSILGRGSSLIGGTIRTELTRDEIHTTILNGFLPASGAEEFPEDKARVGMREMGLPFEADAAITRHLAHFLHQQTKQEGNESGPTFPSAVLFNGGVMKSETLRSQILSVLQSWAGKVQVRELDASNFDQAVAVGAAYYGMAVDGEGIRVRAGTPRTYYIGIESAMPAVPGIPTPTKALCVVPFGTEEGTELEIKDREFGLVIGEKAQFQLLTSTTLQEHTTGTVFEDWGGDIEEVIVMEADLADAGGDSGGKQIPVWLKSKVTEIGTLELWCMARDSKQSWKLEFNLREKQAE